MDAVSTSSSSAKFAFNWWLMLLAICAAALLFRVLILVEAWNKNPLTTLPIEDADVYWRWANDIASGRFVGSGPFFSAPLYPYLLGLIRVFGGGLSMVYCVQVVLHLLTAVLLSLIACQRFGRPAGLIAATLFLLLFEPAFYTGRVLNGTVVVFLITCLWIGMVWAQGCRSSWFWLAIGALLGLNCLANPSMLLAIPPIVLWVLLLGESIGRRWIHSLAVVAGAAILIMPATLHNYAVVGEWIAVSAQGGLTFYQGNNPNSTGTYTPVVGVGTTRETQNLDAYRLVAQELGEPPTWRQTNRFFFEKGLAFWAGNPGHAVRLFRDKVRYFFTGRNYDDIYFPKLEIQGGLGNRLWLAPIPVAWLTLPALVTWVMMLRRPLRFGPELILACIPFLVVVVFWYSSRYRFPSVPLLVVLSAGGFAQIFNPDRHRLWSTLAWSALAVSIGLGWINQSTEFDSLEPWRVDAYTKIATVLADVGKVEESIEWFERSENYGPLSTLAIANYAGALLRHNRGSEALNILERAVVDDPEDPEIHGRMGITLHQLGETERALIHLKQAVLLSPNDPKLRNNLGTFYLMVQRDDLAFEQIRVALHLRPAYPHALINMALVHERRGNYEAALGSYFEALRYDPMHLRSYQMISRIASTYAENGQIVDSIRAIDRAIEVAESAGAFELVMQLRQQRLTFAP